MFASVGLVCCYYVCFGLRKYKKCQKWLCTPTYLSLTLQIVQNSAKNIRNSNTPSSFIVFSSFPGSPITLSRFTCCVTVTHVFGQIWGIGLNDMAYRSHFDTFSIFLSQNMRNGNTTSFGLPSLAWQRPIAAWDRLECYYNRHVWPYLVNKFQKVPIFPLFSAPI